MIDVLVTGAAGKMGSEVVKAVSAAEGMRVVAAVDPFSVGTEVPDGQGGFVVCVDSLEAAISSTSPDVMVEFTHPSSVEANLRTALSVGVDCVVGTTGVSENLIAEVAQSATGEACLFVAPNFAIGAVLMMDFAERAARYMPHVEIIELHHDNKADAPSGTAMRTASLVAAARSEIPEVPGKETEIAAGARGAAVDEVTVHSVRLPGLVAHQEVVFGGQGQTLTIRHDTIDRTSFMPGVVLAVRNVGDLSGLVVGLDELLAD
jgi:4-hydroxy-tetrahydrodipicolinate reductase